MKISKAVDELSQSLQGLGETIKNASTENNTFNQVYGWNAPALDRNDLVEIILDLAKRIRSIDADQVDEDYFQGLTKQIIQLKNNTVPQIFNGGHSFQAVSAVLNTIVGIRFLISDLISEPRWERFEDPNLLPRNLAKRIRGIDAQLKQIEPNLDDLKKSIEQINEARETAQSLPADLASLNEARRAIEDLKKSAANDAFDIDKHRASVRSDVESFKRTLEENEWLKNQLLELQRIGTSTALASAFHERADKLSKSVVWWGWVLFFALTCGVVIGSFRVADINAAMSQPSINWEGVWINVLMTIFSVSAPVWLGWVATSQIKQRFRLAEDYAYKSSISNAYEGYRREAVQLDASFRDKLFGSALSRLDELPGRLVDKESHGSPLHELLASQPLKDAVRAIPDFGKNVIAFAESNLAAFKKNADKKSGESVPSRPEKNDEP